MKSVELLKEMELPFRQDSEVRVGDGGGDQNHIRNTSSGKHKKGSVVLVAFINSC